MTSNTPRLACLLAGLVFLSASSCDRLPKFPRDTAPPAAAAKGSDLLARLADGPGLRPGLWEAQFTDGGPRRFIERLCVDEGLSKRFQDIGTPDPGNPDCQAVSASRSANAIDVVTQCKGESLLSTYTIHWDLVDENTYHETLTQTLEPALVGGNSEWSLDGKFVGPCLRGMKPGDLERGRLDLGYAEKLNIYQARSEPRQ